MGELTLVGTGCALLASIRAAGTLLPLAALLLFAAGCVTGTQHEGRVILARDVAKVKVAKTTRQEVLDIFGPPSSFARVPEAAPRAPGAPLAPAVGERGVPADVYLYEYKEENESFFSVILIYTHFKREKLADVLMVSFDPADRVKLLAYVRQTEAGGQADEKAEKK